jgi:hypothetical protein
MKMSKARMEACSNGVLAIIIGTLWYGAWANGAGRFRVPGYSLSLLTLPVPRHTVTRPPAQRASGSSRQLAAEAIWRMLAPEPRLVEEARRILATHGARHIRFYGDTSVTDL